jgi:hypothetical protein
LEVGTLIRWLNCLEAWLLKHEQGIAVCALAGLRTHPPNNKITLKEQQQQQQRWRQSQQQAQEQQAWRQ